MSVEFATTVRVVSAVRRLSLEIARGVSVAVVGRIGLRANPGHRVIDHAARRAWRRPHRRWPARLHPSRWYARRSRSRRCVDASRDIRGAEIAMIFQEPMTSLNPVFPVGEQIAESIRLHQRKNAAAARAEALRMLEQVRIPEARSVLDRFPHQLSGGMRQRVMIAMALSCRPALLIADEPTTALDVTIQAQILTLIRLLQDEMHMAVMFITHDMGVVAEVADRVVVMYAGEKVEEGTAEAIFATPSQPYTRALLAAVPKLGALRGEDAPRKFASVAAESSPARASQHRRTGAVVRHNGAPLLSVRKLTTRFDVKSGFFGRVCRPARACGRAGELRSAGRRNAGPGRRVGLREVDDRPLAPAARRWSLPAAASNSKLPRHREACRQCAASGTPRHPDDLPGSGSASLDPRLTVGFSVAAAALHPRRRERRRSGGSRRVAPRARGPRARARPPLSARILGRATATHRDRACAGTSIQRIIVADEAVSALDVCVVIQAQIVNLLLDLQSEFGVSYLFISHDMAVVERVRHRVAVMYLGQISRGDRPAPPRFRA